ILATGYAVISIQKSSNPAQQRILSIRASKLDAYRTLLEQVYGQSLEAHTTIAELVVKNDTFKARVQGVIYDARLVSISPVGNDTYETTLSLDKSVVDDLRKLYLKSMSQQKLSFRHTTRPATI
ncbi:MAG: LPP20 family lipoprotein, partial [Sinobacterium sp.]